mmetsp:Transcript_32641/g.49189  ORF Transcript_32641/g.49189 Transcript_32641/m.49189 type:complete len:91 (-) Transcript_32641:16-288(-)|eukprot:CAMPEP_0178919850 /NCGR_PEP_ID=MMETSP0786-20121207/14670_1 /TAXON_ID=186022 /ORGANISM="Thalassionema frauenfeldii, Strain CCMP 1798" /LENGTH=90 /DNA_ID=CAMNT_0020593835 /DNA_START=44 /DNA_END=316 /DNA_ORIENTATION=-
MTDISFHIAASSSIHHPHLPAAFFPHTGSRPALVRHDFSIRGGASSSLFKDWRDDHPMLAHDYSAQTQNGIATVHWSEIEILYMKYRKLN